MSTSTSTAPIAAIVTDSTTRTVDWRRLVTPVNTVALIVLAIGSLAMVLGNVFAGQVAQQPSWQVVRWLAIAMIGGSILDMSGRYLWFGEIDRVEGGLRRDLLDAALNQPLAHLGEQAVGEVLDRVDDDTREVGNLMRWQSWMVLRALFGAVPMWIIAGLTWWPAWFMFPGFAALTWLGMRSLLKPIQERKIVEEAAWTDHAAALEEGIAGRDDLRTSLGQSFAIRRLAQLSADVHRKFKAVLDLEKKILLRGIILLNALLAAVAVIGATMATRGHTSVAQLVTLFLITTQFVGVVGFVAEQMPDIQAGLGAVARLRQMMALQPEPVGGRQIESDEVDLEFRHLTFAYDEGTFALRDIDLHVPAGQTLALVGRSGSGKSTLASLISRAVEPSPGMVLLGGVDVLDLDLQNLRRQVGVVTQRTEILAGTLAENITLFADLPRRRVVEVIDELGLTDWVAGLDQGLDTLLGPGGTTLSAGEEQLVAFARLLIRDVHVVVLDEATARMDPLTEHRVVAASDRLLRGRTGLLVAHRLSTIARADLVAVMRAGELVQFGSQTALSRTEGPFRDLLRSAGSAGVGVDEPDDARPVALPQAGAEHAAAHANGSLVESVGSARRRREVLARAAVETGPSLARGIWSALTVRPEWGLLSVGLFLGVSLTGSAGALTGFAWGHAVEQVAAGQQPWWWLAALVVMVFAGPVMLSEGIARYPRWWIEVLLRVRLAVLVGQTAQHRLEKVPAGEVVARAMDSDRYARYADRWVDFINGLVVVVVTAIAASNPVAGLVLFAVVVAATLASAIGRPIAGRTATRASAMRATFGRALVSTLESARTVKLAGRTPEVHAHLLKVDSGRVDAAVREHHVQAVLDAVPVVMIKVGVVVVWAAVVGGWWGLATALLVVNALNGFEWFGRVAGAVVTEAPGTRSWQVATQKMAGGVDLMTVPDGVDLETGEAPAAPPVEQIPLEVLSVRDVTAIHEDGTVGVENVSLTVRRGELVLLLGQVGSGKSSLLRTLAGLIDYSGEVLWNGQVVGDAELFMRPGQVAYVAQVPRVMSGTFADNVQLGFTRAFDAPVSDARLTPDVEDAGGPTAMVGHRGVRLSGGQVQRLALARALAADAELLLADDVSSALDARTEVELWEALRHRSATVVGATSKRAALARADRVVVMVDGEIAAEGPWEELSTRWSHLAG
ncbi:ATP-binding cassette domain-containing protein [Aestuariimicrobium kwangyangense]|uniref:ATP-binding cassette domain-containing protein n=1 Tax=Aestuariimicrobium kwangyangense TaxID=396389 RepID=UPI0003B455C7|nr:ABC transporter ATP-binding protein [Aestuariimicrobium kwangyangense]